ncbi:MAG: thiamine pyrophosphate-binding protein, partial [Clostridia bacterium]|nr:thiamine pyrophosphate-binding protein [Clostridia bacterium]
DLILSLGCRLSIRQVSYNWENFAPKAYKIVVDIDQAELKKPTITVDYPIHANVKTVIEKLNETDYQAKPGHKNWLAWAREVNLKYPACLKEFYNSDTPVNPYVFVDVLFDRLKEDDYVVCSNGSACVITFQGAKIKKGQRLFHNSGSASMGFGLPAAIGAAVSQNGKKIYCLEGDGSLQMNIQELQTLVHNKLNLTLFVFNNSGYHSIRQTQTNLFTPPMYGVDGQTGVSFPDLEKIAFAYGIPFRRFSSIADMCKNIEKEMTVEGPKIIEIIVDKNQFFQPKLSARKLPDGTMVSPTLEDMAPFLDREEYFSNFVDFDDEGNII